MGAMKIKLSYVGWLKLPVKTGSVVEIAEGATVSDVMTSFHIPKHQQRHITPFVNDEEQKPSFVLRENDDLMLVIAIGGG
jgi:hypothetical protein